MMNTLIKKEGHGGVYCKNQLLEMQQIGWESRLLGIWMLSLRLHLQRTQSTHQHILDYLQRAILTPHLSLSPALGIPIDDKGYDAENDDIWAGDKGYNVWGDEETKDSGDSESVKSAINIVESPEVIVLSSDEVEDDEMVGKHGKGSEGEDTRSSGSETSNSSDPDFKPRHSSTL